MRRKSLLTIAACLMTVLMSGTVVACSCDNPDDDNPPVTPPTGDTNPPDTGDEEDESRSYWLKLNQEEVELLEEGMFSLSAQLYLGSAVVEGATFTWESENPSIATVSANGLVTAVAEGETEITVKASGYTNVEYTVAVKVNPSLTLDLSQQEVELAKIDLEGYKTSTEVEYEAKWKNQAINDAVITVSSSNENVSATLNGKKIVITAQNVGDAVVTAKYEKDGKTVETYVNVSVVKPYISTGETYLLSTGKKNTLDLSLIDYTKDYTVDSIVRVAADDKEFPIDKEASQGSVLKLTDTASLGNDGSKTTALVIETENIRIGVDVKGYTHVIRSAKDFDDMKEFLVDTTFAAGKQSGLTVCKEIKGYYVLANDIDFAEVYPDGYNSPFSYMNIGYAWNEAIGWRGTFDGNGHVIKNLKIVQTTQGTAGTYTNSLFGTIANGGTVKNVAFENASIADGLHCSAVFANAIFGTVENVFIEATVATTVTSEGNFVFAGVNNTIRGLRNYAKVSNVTVIVNGLGGYDYVMGGETDGINAIKDSMVIIGAGEDKIHASYSTIATLQEKNGNVKVYEDVSDASKATNLTECGSTTFATTDSKFTASWNGEVVHESLLYTTLDEALYSIDDATLDLTGVSGEIVKITDEAGNQITYNAQTKKISGHSLLNGTATSATGAVTNILVYTTEDTYKIPLKVCTDIINSAQEFDEMKKFLVDTTISAGRQSGLTYCKEIKGYYVLANDIDFADGYSDGYNSPFSYMNIGYAWSDAIGWRGTFDGNGYAIKNLKIVQTTQGTAGVYTNSLFGTIAASGTVKNVAFENASIADGLHCSAVFANAIFGKVENVDIEATVATTVTSEGNFVFAGVNTSARGLVNYANVSNVTIVVNGLGNLDYVMGGAANGINAIKGSMVIKGAVRESQVHSQYANIEAITAANNNIQVHSVELAERLYSIDDATLDLTGVEGEIVKITDKAGNEISYDAQTKKVSGNAILNGVATSAKGEVMSIAVYTADKTYVIPLKVCTDVLYTAKDFDDMKKFLVDTTDTANAKLNFTYCKKITGYFVLGADLDFSTDYADGYASPFSYWDIGGKVTGYSYGWKATFDGNGHTISNLKLVASSTVGGTWQNSLFGIIAADNADGAQGVVKNVAFKNCSLADNLYNSAFLANIVYGTIENVYLEVNVATSHTNANGNAAFIGMDATRGIESTDAKTSISNVTVVVNGLGANDYAIKGKAAGLVSITGKVIVIGVAENKVFEGYATLAALQEANANISAYTDVASASSATIAQTPTLTTCGSAEFATADDTFTISWNDKIVYEKALTA